MKYVRRVLRFLILGIPLGLVVLVASIMETDDPTSRDIWDTLWEGK